MTSIVLRVSWWGLWQQKKELLGNMGQEPGVNRISSWFYVCSKKSGCWHHLPFSKRYIAPCKHSCMFSIRMLSFIFNLRARFDTNPTCSATHFGCVSMFIFKTSIPSTRCGIMPIKMPTHMSCTVKRCYCLFTHPWPAFPKSRNLCSSLYHPGDVGVPYLYRPINLLRK